MIDINHLTINQILEGYKAKKWSVVEVVRSYVERIESQEAQVKAFITITADRAIDQAHEKDELISKNPEIINTQPLFGIPYAAKDLYSTKGIKTTAGAKILENYIPQFDATTIIKINEAGGILVGKTNQDPWGFGSSGENSEFFPTHNPWNLEYVPGGTSSGSAAAVAARMVPFALGTDTGGSCRCPAAFCGVTGLKPTYGRVSRYGIIPSASSLDSIGHLTVSIEDSSRVLSVTAGHDPYDATTPNQPVPKYEQKLNKEVKELKIGVPKEYLELRKQQTPGVTLDVDKKVKLALKTLEQLGANLVEISLPHTQEALAAYYIIQPAEASSNLARFDGIRFGHIRETFGPEAKRRIMLGTYILSAGYYDAYYKKAMKVRTLVCEDFRKAFTEVDIILGPVMPHGAFKLGEKVNDPLSLYLEDVLTVPINLAGLTAISIPCGFESNGLPVGMQIIGPQFSEELLFQIGYAYQQVTDFHKKLPPLISS